MRVQSAPLVEDGSFGRSFLAHHPLVTLVQPEPAADRLRCDFHRLIRHASPPAIDFPQNPGTDASPAAAE
jgi:hypothetical protein